MPRLKPGVRTLAVALIAVNASAVGQAPIFQLLKDPLPPTATGQLAFGDFDGDGDLDALSFGSNIFLNDGNATFTANATPSVVTTGQSAIDPVNALFFAVADFTGDGLDDLITTGAYPWLSLWSGQSGGVLAATPSILPSPSALGSFINPRAIAAGDVDGDGDVDVVGALGWALTVSSMWAPVQIELMLNTGNGGFVNATIAQLPVVLSNATQLYLRDVDGDGDLDIFLSDLNGGNPCGDARRMLLNNGSGFFSPPLTLPAPLVRSYVVLAEVNGDGLPDLVYSRVPWSWLCPAVCGVSLNLGTGVFGPVTTSPCPDPGPIAALDLNSDGIEEIARVTAGGITVYSVPAAGAWLPLQSIPVPAEWCQAVDVDGDGDRDLVVTTFEGRNEVLLNDGQGALVWVAGYPPGAPASGEFAMVAGDIDGDGNADYAWWGQASSGSTPAPPGSMAIAINDGSGSFGQSSGACGAVCLPGGVSSCSRLFPIDFDSDGKLDLYVSEAGQQPVCPTGPDRIYRSFAGSWVLAQTLPATHATNVLQRDLNGDGLQDLVVTSQSWTAYVVCIFNLGSLGFSAPVQLPPAQETAVLDADGDSDLDIVEARPTGCALLLNDGAGNFTQTPASNLGSVAAQRVVAADLDGDGDQDLILDNTVWFNAAGLSFTQGSLLPVTSVRDPLPLDADGDGDIDLVATTSPSAYSIAYVLLLNDGSGVFTVGETLPVGPSYPAVRLSAADFDRDGDIDMLVPGPRVLTNTTRQLSRNTLLRPGRTASLSLRGPPNAAWFLFASTGAANTPIPPFGTVFLDLSAVQLIGSGLLAPSGVATLSATLPSSPSLVGFTTYLQALIDGPPRVTNFEIMTVLGV